MPVPGWNIPDPTSPFDGCARSAIRAALDRMEVPARNELHQVLKPEAAQLLDAIAVRAARGRGACDLLVGKDLALLERTRGYERLGYSKVESYAAERLGLNPSFVRRLVRLDESLRVRPLLRAAVWRGDVTRRKAEIVMARARGEEEQRWVELARTRTARELEALAKDPGATEMPDEDERSRRIFLPLNSEEQKVSDLALEIAGIVGGSATTRMQRVEMLSMEFVGAHGDLLPEPDQPEVSPPGLDEAGAFQIPHSGLLGVPYPTVDYRALLEKESRRWSFFADPPPVVTEDQDGDPDKDPYAIQERLRALVAERNAWDEELGRVCLLIQACGSWRTAMFTSFEHYCHERLGMGASTVKQRIALERKLYELPPLRRAMSSGRLSYEKARLVARVATLADVEARIDEAVGSTCIALRRSLDGGAPAPAEQPPGGEVQMWNGRGLDVVVPERVDRLLSDAMVAARARANQWLTPSQAYVVICAHFITTYAEEAKRRTKATHPTKRRDRCLCLAPGCTLPADEVHHTWFRSQGGPLAPWNEVALCIIHHRLIHRGFVRVFGTAPHGLVWILGEKEVRASIEAERGT